MIVQRENQVILFYFASYQPFTSYNSHNNKSKYASIMGNNASVNLQNDTEYDIKLFDHTISKGSCTFVNENAIESGSSVPVPSTFILHFFTSSIRNSRH